MASPRADVSELLRQAIRDARAAGLGPAADELQERTSAAFTSSSELLGEMGLAVEHFLRRERGKVPADVEEKLRACLAAVRRVWPRLR
jgi:hypothetical protein